MLRDRNNTPVRYGLGIGTSDLIGWRTEIIGGQRVARFVAVECKSEKGRLTDEQAAFLATVRQAGGLAIEARSVEDAEIALRRAVLARHT